MMFAGPSRPVLRYHGGKWMLAPWIISHFPPHRIYVEPFCGAASVLMRKSRVYSEVLNDLDGEIVNVFRVLRDPAQAAELARVLSLTPFARAEFVASYSPATDPVEQARRTVVKAYMGFGSSAVTAVRASDRGFKTPAKYYKRPTTGFRANANRSGTVPAHDWANYPEQVAAFCERLRGVTLENRPAIEVIFQQDSPDTLFYIDPPYPKQARSDTGDDYRHEMADDDHRQLAEVLHSVKGMVVLSGYPCELYDRELFPHWRRVTKDWQADGAAPRTEALWLNPAAAARARQQSLFDR